MVKRITEFASRKSPTGDDIIVYIDGAFDVFNVGHAATLEKAKACGTYLIVGVFDDRTVNEMKGCNYPVMNLGERVLNVCACKHVDDVVIGAPLDVTEEFLRSLNIRVVVQGSQTLHPSSEVPCDERGVQPNNEVPRRLGIFKEVVSDYPALTVTTIAERIACNRLQYIAERRERSKSCQ